jgi:hypothetical protein
VLDHHICIAEQVVLPVTLEELLAPDSPFVKKTVKIASDPVGYGFVIRGGRPVHVHTVDPAGPAAAAGLTVRHYSTTFKISGNII